MTASQAENFKSRFSRGFSVFNITFLFQRIVSQVPRGLRRQFLMMNETNIIVLLERGKKVTSCNNILNDVTESVKCKVSTSHTISSATFQPVDGLGEITLNERVSCPASEISTEIAPVPPVLGSSTKVVCRCPEERLFTCTTTVKSAGNTHTVICNNMTSTTISCGSELVGRNLGLISFDQYNHHLCTLRAYLSILTDIEWSCKDPSIPVPPTSRCPGDCKCGLKGTTRIVGGEQSVVRAVIYYCLYKGIITGRKIPLDHAR